jgi:DNA-binding response OmpR family regulator
VSSVESKGAEPTLATPSEAAKPVAREPSNAGPAGAGGDQGDADTIVEEHLAPRAITLLVEPDAPTAAHLAHALRRAGLEVVVCADVAASARVATEERPSVVLCDLDLADDAGVNAVRRLRALGTAASACPLVLLLPPGEQRTSLVGFTTPLDAYVVKPFATDALVARVEASMAIAAGLVSAFEERRTAMRAGERLEAELTDVSAASLLALLEREGASGMLELRYSGRFVRLELNGGRALSGNVQGAPASVIEVLRIAITFEQGSACFQPGASAPPAMTGLLVDAARRRDDEMRRDREPARSAPGRRPPPPPSRPGIAAVSRPPSATPAGGVPPRPPPPPPPRAASGAAPGASAGEAAPSAAARSKVDPA